MWLALLAASAVNLGTNVHLPPVDTLDLAVDLGGKWIRIDLNWELAEPAQGQWNWAPFDAVIDGAKARGLKVYATLGYTPAWASTGNRLNDGRQNDVPVGMTYRTFVEAAVARYQAKVDVFGTWNEPNLEQFFEGTKQEWIDVVYRPAVLGIRAQCATCVIAGPEVATIGDLYDDYITAGLAAAPPDLLAAHIYSAFPLDDSAAGLSKDSFFNKLESRRVIGPWMGTPSIREAAIAAGHPNLPIWITETGREAPVGDATNLEKQRLYAQRVLDAMDTRPWWAGTIFYELSEEHPGGMWPNIHWGLALRTHDPDGTPLDNFDRKPVFTYIKNRLAAAPPPMIDAGVSDASVTDDASSGGGGHGNPDGGSSEDEDPPVAGCGCRSSSPPTSGIVFAMMIFASLRLRRRHPR